MHTRLALLIVAALFAAQNSAHAAIVWTTGATDVTFTKPALTSPALPENQDRIAATVWLTRGTSAGLFNAAEQASYTLGAPSGTQWAVSGLNGNPTFSYGSGAAKLATLTFSNWDVAYGGSSNLGANIISKNAVLHILNSDVYLDIQFTQYASGTSGAFTLTRANGVVPEPASLAVLSAGALLLVRRRKLRQ